MTAVISACIFKNLSKLVIYCVAILILKMEENMQHFCRIVLYYFEKGETTTEIQTRICAAYREDTVTDQMHQNWFAKFCAGNFSEDDAPWSGRPVEVDGYQIQTLIENNQPRWEIGDILKISKSIKLLVEMCLLFYTKNTWAIWPT